MVIGHPTNVEQQQSVVSQIDTGADISVVPLRVASTLNLPRAGEIWVESYRAVRERVPIYFARLTIGRFVFRRVPMVAIEHDEGLLGRDVLNLLVTTLDGPKLQFDLTT